MSIFSNPTPDTNCYVKAENEPLVEARVLQHIDFSEYAAPIIAVSKPNGKVRFRGELFKF